MAWQKGKGSAREVERKRGEGRGVLKGGDEGWKEREETPRRCLEVVGQKSEGKRDERSKT